MMTHFIIIVKQYDDIGNIFNSFKIVLILMICRQYKNIREHDTITKIFEKEQTV